MVSAHPCREGWSRTEVGSLGAPAPGARANIISESPGAGAWMIPRLLGFAPGPSPLTHWLPAWQSPDQLLVSLSILVCFSIRCRHQVCALPRLLGGEGCWAPGSSEASRSPLPLPPPPGSLPGPQVELFPPQSSHRAGYSDVRNCLFRW